MARYPRNYDYTNDLFPPDPIDFTGEAVPAQDMYVGLGPMDFSGETLPDEMDAGIYQDDDTMDFAPELMAAQADAAAPPTYDFAGSSGVDISDVMNGRTLDFGDYNTPGFGIDETGLDADTKRQIMLEYMRQRMGQLPPDLMQPGLSPDILREVDSLRPPRL